MNDRVRPLAVLLIVAVFVGVGWILNDRWKSSDPVVEVAELTPVEEVWTPGVMVTTEPITVPMNAWVEMAHDCKLRPAFSREAVLAGDIVQEYGRIDRLVLLYIVARRNPGSEQAAPHGCMVLMDKDFFDAFDPNEYDRLMERQERIREWVKERTEITP